MRTLTLAENVDLDKVASMLPPNFTGADFSALTSEAYMIAVKERINVVTKEMEEFRLAQLGAGAPEQLLPETYFKLKHPDNLEAQQAECIVAIE
jgi:SpoVK/Ycf46/Vps4 family AAA+-type ATPase